MFSDEKTRNQKAIWFDLIWFTQVKELENQLSEMQKQLLVQNSGKEEGDREMKESEIIQSSELTHKLNEIGIENRRE